MAKKEGNELATVKVYLNTSIIATLLGVGFLTSTLIFGVILIALKQKTTLAWFSKVKAGTQSGLDDYIIEVMTNNHNLAHADHCFLEIANDNVNEMMLFDPDPKMCKFFKKTYVNPRRWGVMIREKQIQELLEKGLLQ